MSEESYSLIETQGMLFDSGGLSCAQRRAAEPCARRDIERELVSGSVEPRASTPAREFS